VQAMEVAAACTVRGAPGPCRGSEHGRVRLQLMHQAMPGSIIEGGATRGQG
jgi:hypothetical protein